MDWSGAKRPLSVALFAVFLALTWQALTVHYNYGGNWNALFCTGASFRRPPAVLQCERIYLFPGQGYDGQIYHYVAHDPLIRRGFAQSFDIARLRYRRLLVPAAAWTLAGGRDAWIDPAYYAVILAFAGLGTFWTARMAESQGLHAACGLAFLFVPAAAISIDRMTVDIALAAFTVGIAWNAMRERWRAVWALCALAALTRETGMLFAIGFAAYFLIRERTWLRALWFAAATLPAGAWFLYVAARTQPFHTNTGPLIPFSGWGARVIFPHPYNFTPMINAAATAFDYVALAGMVMAIGYAALHVDRLWRSPLGWALLLFAALPAAINVYDVWEEAYAFGRVFTPVLLLVALDAMRKRNWIGAAPIAMVAARVGMQFAPQVNGIVAGLLR